MSRFRAVASSARDTAFIFFGIVTWIPAVIFFTSNVGEVQKVNGPSMYPYLNTDYDQNLKKDKCWNYKWRPAEGLQRGMIVTFWSPVHPEVQVVKRVIALEGDKVQTRAPYPEPIAQVPFGHVWVEGDGGDAGKRSLDSNHYGPLSKSMITGRITHVLWPWRSLGPVRWWEFKPKRLVVRADSPEIQEPGL